MYIFAANHSESPLPALRRGSNYDKPDLAAAVDHKAATTENRRCCPMRWEEHIGRSGCRIRIQNHPDRETTGSFRIAGLTPRPSEKSPQELSEAIQNSQDGRSN